jgi:hypothetical protein
MSVLRIDRKGVVLGAAIITHVLDNGPEEHAGAKVVCRRCLTYIGGVEMACIDGQALEEVVETKSKMLA